MDLFVPSKLREKVEKWRKTDYPCEYSAISEIMNWNLMEIEEGNKTLRYLRKAQFEALETYWYMRLVEKTPHVFELYKRLYTDNSKLIKALGIPLNEEVTNLLINKGVEGLISFIKTDEKFVQRNKLESIRESLTLDYPSYILALAMGSGKTVLIGSIIASEFALALEYGNNFVTNALVFAPGKTIVGALKEISDIQYEKILPPRLYKQFISSMKITYTQDKEKDINIVKGSNFNIIITNTEKIRIQKPTSGSVQFNLLNYKEFEKNEEAQDIANLRLQTIASLPHLAIFSDEAHHTYGQNLDSELKKVRKTVDYLAENTNVIVVINTTGTPYFQKQMLKDVIYWYGLSQGIKDGILKEIKDSIFSYDVVDIENFVDIVLTDFFKEYKNTKLFDGTPSKIAIYFPQTSDVSDIKPFVERKIIELGLDPSIVINVDNKSDELIKDSFNNRINEPHNPYRVYLLVNMGTEGWNCPSLFATALARKLKSSNNFVLQAASRCLRQVPHNKQRARIYLSEDNVAVLDSQLKETFGENLKDLMVRRDMRQEKLILRKIEIPPIVLKRKMKKVVLNDNIINDIVLSKPISKIQEAKKTVYNTVDFDDKKKVLVESEVEKLILFENTINIYELAVEFSVIYRINLQEIYEKLLTIYPEREILNSHIIELKKQIESQTKNYKITEEEVEIVLALIKPDGFDKEKIDDEIVYTAEIIYHKDKEDLLLKYETYKELNKKDFSFHYSPYKMDSHPEKDFFDQILNAINEDPADIDDIYFMGAIQDPKKTDFLFEYVDKTGKYRSYTPDFLIRKKNGKVLIVEIKGEIFRDETKEMAIRELEGLNPDTLKYEILLTKEDQIGFENINKVKKWCKVK